MCLKGVCLPPHCDYEGLVVGPIHGWLALMEAEVVHKVAAYITCLEKLLVFRHVDFPEAGIQIPSGTVDHGEDLESAVLREVHEETGLTGLSIVSFLGTRVYDMRPIDGTHREIHRHYYHLVLPGPIPSARWHHWEESPSDGTTEPILFELYWVSFPDEIPDLNGNQGDLLPRLRLMD